MRCLLDTNVVLRVSAQRHPLHSAIAAFVDSLFEQGHELCIVPQILYEYWAVSTRPVSANGLGLSTREARDGLAEVKSTFLLLRDERAILAEWESIVVGYAVQGRATYDARLVAAMRRHGIQQIVTCNAADFQRFPDIAVLDPAEHSPR